MEPMTLGSPSGSPATSPYLPSFLMGDQQGTPRSNTLSPNKGARNISFAASPGVASPADYNRSMLGQKTLFQHHGGANTSGMGVATPMQSHNPVLSGPPTQGLFDSLRCEQNKVQSPVGTPQHQPSQLQSHSHFLAGSSHMQNGAFGMNQNYHQQSFQAQQFNESCLSGASFNASRGMMSPLMPATPTTVAGFNSLQCPPTPRYTEFWVTIYGFPPSCTSTILQHFAQCGTIVDKVFPPQNGNWVHLKYSSRLECDKALNYNEKILSNNIMIGVTPCKDRNIVDKENFCENNPQPCKVRPLAQTAYKSAQKDLSVVACPTAPQKSSGIMNKAIDLIFGW